jgi:hypothetical protein
MGRFWTHRSIDGRHTGSYTKRMPYSIRMLGAVMAIAGLAALLLGLVGKPQTIALIIGKLDQWPDEEPSKAPRLWLIGAGIVMALGGVILLFA